MRRSFRLLLGAAGIATVAGAVLAAPRVLPELPGFQVRRVEVTGTRLLEAREVLRSSGIQGGQSVWADPGPWVQALERHPVIASAEITRRLPGTLRVQVREKRPVAYLADGVLTPVTASGERLRVDPSFAAADLPIVRSAPKVDSVPRHVFAEVERLAGIDGELLAAVSEIRPRAEDGEVLLLRHRRADIVIPVGAPAERLVELRAVLADVDERDGQGDARGVALVDLRFADQIIVRLPPSLQKP